MRWTRATWTCLGVGLALGLHVVAGWGALPGLAQSTNTTFTSSTSSSSGFESPPACSPVGSTRQVVTVTLETQIGPGCEIVGNRDVPNPAAVCAGHPYSGFGTLFTVAIGTTNFNANTNTETLTCVGNVPALPWPFVGGLGVATLALGGWLLRRRRSA